MDSLRDSSFNSMGYLSKLLRWNLEDPPDAEEIARNGKVCSGEFFCVSTTISLILHFAFVSRGRFCSIGLYSVVVPIFY